MAWKQLRLVTSAAHVCQPFEQSRRMSQLIQRRIHYEVISGHFCRGIRMPISKGSIRRFRAATCTAAFLSLADFASLVEENVNGQEDCSRHYDRHSGGNRSTPDLWRARRLIECSYRVSAPQGI